MLLATRCPHCETVFRLQREQLALHDGLVRCGHCRQVFDAARALVPAEPEAAAAQAAPHAPEQQPAPPRRLFDATSPDRRPLEAGHRDFAPGAWDMWAPWLDGAVDPKLQMTSTSVSTASDGAVATSAAAAEARNAESDAPTQQAREASDTQAALAPRPGERTTHASPETGTGAHAARIV